MPRYRFNVPLTVDDIEIDLADDHEAWSQAVTLLGELLQDIDGGLPRSTDWTLLVREEGREVARLRVTACLQGHGPAPGA